MKRGLALVLALALLLSAVVTASAEGALPTTWDLTSIYGSVDEWQADYDTVMEMLDNYEQYRGKLNNAQDICDYLRLFSTPISAAALIRPTRYLASCRRS